MAAAIATCLAWRAVYVLVPNKWLLVLAHAYVWAYITSRVVGDYLFATIGVLLLGLVDRSFIGTDWPGDELHKLLAVHTSVTWSCCLFFFFFFNFLYFHLHIWFFFLLTSSD